MHALGDNTVENESLSNATNNNIATMHDEILYDASVLDGPQIRYGYHISNFKFMVPESTRCEVIENYQVFKLPNSPLWLYGLINNRGNITPVMDMHPVIGNPIEQNITQHIIVIDQGNKAIAIIADELPHSLENTTKISSLSTLPNNITKFCKPGFKYNDDEWYEFDIQNFFISLNESTIN